jgi:hypothetical protein
MELPRILDHTPVATMEDSSGEDFILLDKKVDSV